MVRAMKSVELRNAFKEICDTVVDDGEVVIITRPRSENVVLISEKAYNAMVAAARKKKRNG